MTPFDIINSITYNKNRLIDETNEKQYNAYNVNKGLSYFKDTIFYAQAMNMNYHLDPLLQHDYLFCTVRKQKRYAKWVKKDKDLEKILDHIMTHYNYGYTKALQALSLLSEEQLERIIARNKGELWTK